MAAAVAAAPAPGPAAAGGAAALAALLPDERDLVFEQDLLRDPYSVRAWLRYLDARADAPLAKRCVLYERALRALPGSYKLWNAYLLERVRHNRALRPDDDAHDALIGAFERALVTLHKMPRIWLHYAQYLASQRRITKTRRVLDRALASLPPTQHERVWDVYVRFVTQDFVPTDTALRVYRRYVRFDPAAKEDYAALLAARGRFGDAAVQIAGCLDAEGFQSVRGKSRHELWMELCELVTTHPEQMHALNVDAILRSGITTHKTGVGRLWAGLADFYIRSAAFERARDVFEEALSQVMTVADFSLVFDAYAQFEESMITAMLEAQTEDEGAQAAQQGGGADDGEWNVDDFGAEVDLDLYMARLEMLMDRRPELLSSVRLRQNPHNVNEWRKRVKLFDGDGARQVRTFSEAVRAIDPAKAVGRLGTLWEEFAKFYEAHGDVANARVVFKKATQVKFRAAEELAGVWCAFAELELRQKNYKGALALCRGAVMDDPVLAKGETKASFPQTAVRKSLKLWGFYIDLEESLGTFASVRKAYERVLDLRIATPQIILNFCAFMEENKYFEESFKLYERGVALFRYPQVKEIWATYLRKFVARYGGTKLERARDLFEQAVGVAPPEEAKPLFLEYGALEEKHGLAKHAMGVYRRATRAVAGKDKRAVYEHYIARAAEYYGVMRTREIYEDAIESDMPQADVRHMCRRYAALEKSLGEIDRARAIFVSAASVADPQGGADFWKDWNDFEVQHGNEETFKEMLRIKRSVSTAYSAAAIMTNPAAKKLQEQQQQQQQQDGEQQGGMQQQAAGGDAMQALEAARAAAATAMPAIGSGLTSLSGFVSAGVVQQKPPEEAGAAGAPANAEEIDLDAMEAMDGGGGGGAAAAPAANDEEIDLDGDLGAEEAEAPKQLPVPAAVFGGLQPRAVGAGAGGSAMGALERMRASKRQKTDG